jgi:glycosyltransferase involved in cell wall biosynthesis
VRRGIRRREREPAALWRDLHAIRRRNRYLARRLLTARRIIALSEFQKAMFVRNGLPVGRIEVIEHGLEVAGLRPGLRRPGPVPRIVFVGSLVPDKGPHVLLEALARVPTLDVECRIYGALPDTAYGQRLAALAAADRRVSLRGIFPPDEFGAVLAEADLLAVPSVWYENGPLVVKAAFYVGVPVLASRIGSLTEMVTPGRNGWLETAGDPARWAAAITRIAADRTAFAVEPTPVKTMDENARELFAIYAAEVERL